MDIFTTFTHQDDKEFDFVHYAWTAEGDFVYELYLN